MAEAHERVLVYDRIDANRRNALLLLALFAVVLLPAVAYVTQYLTFVAFLGLVPLGGANAAIPVILAAIIAIVIIVLAVYVQYGYASALMLRFAGAREVGRDREPELLRTVENLCIGAGVPQPSVYVVETSAANAFATGLDPERASLVVTRGLLELLDRRELEAVIAHELSQIGNYDTRLRTVLAAGVGMLRLPFAIVSGFFRFLFGLHWILGAGALLYLGVPLLLGVIIGLSFIASDPAFGLTLLLGTALPLYVVLGAPLLGLLIQRSVSREREFLADADAVLLTGGAENLATALAKIAAARGSDMKVGGATAHLYIVDPLPGDAPWWDSILLNHPPIEDRIALLADMGGGIPPSVLRAAAEAGAGFRSGGTRLTVAKASQRPAQPPARDDESWTGMTEPEEVKRAPVAFRLGETGATVYARPDATSSQLAQLPCGALIAVLETAGEFLQVITPDDSFGFIPRETAMSEVDLDGEHGRR